MLRARNVERNFQVYPPYWYYRAKAAKESGNDSEALICWDKFAEVWRPVLRNDPYKLEEAKFRVQRLAGNAEGNREEIRRLLEVIQDNTTAGDWSNNLFAGVAYFLMGDKDEGIACVEVNVDFGYEESVSKTILAEMKKGELDALKQHYLTKEEIIAVTLKHGCISADTNSAETIPLHIARKLSISENTKILTKMLFWFSYVGFGYDRIYWADGYGDGDSVGSMSYDELRNNPKITYAYLQKLFKDFHSEVVPTLMELKELE